MGYGQAQRGYHVIQHMVLQITAPVLGDLQGHVTITQVITGACQQYRVIAGHGGHGFGRRLYRDNQTIFRAQAITVAQHLAALEHQAHLFAAVQLRAQAAFLAQFERQCEHGLGGFGLGQALGDFD